MNRICESILDKKLALPSLFKRNVAQNCVGALPKFRSNFVDDKGLQKQE